MFQSAAHFDSDGSSSTIASTPWFVGVPWSLQKCTKLPFPCERLTAKGYSFERQSMVENPYQFLGGVDCIDTPICVFSKRPFRQMRLKRNIRDSN